LIKLKELKEQIESEGHAWDFLLKMRKVERFK
jgi:hypothetical protein